MDQNNKTRRALNKSQMATLKLLYKYRFITTELLARSEGKKNGTFARSRLAILQEQGCIARNFDKSYKLRGRFASYYLLPKGMKALKDAGDVNAQALKNIYNDRNASESFIQHSLAVFRVSCDLYALYGDSLQFFTKSDLAAYDYFPRPLPDAYVVLSVGTVRKHFFLDIFKNNTPFFAMARKVKQYVTYEESGEWEATDSPFPAILAACDDTSLAKRLNKRSYALLDNAGSDIAFYTSTLDAVAKATDKQANIWQGTQGTEKAKSLQELY